MRIVFFEANYADEFDISGFEIMTKKEWKKFKKNMKKVDREFFFVFGTNEEIEFSNGKEFLDCISVKKITESEAEVIKSTIGEGFGFEFSDIWESIEEEANELED